MTRTFLVAIDSDDTSPSSLAETALDIQDELEQGSFNVISVRPWAGEQQSSFGTPPPTNLLG